MGAPARALIALFALGWALLLAAADMDYGLAPEKIADGTWVLTGRREDFSFTNGGNIVNTGFLVGTEGVIVIDTGSSRRYGEQMLAAIRRLTPLPVGLTLNTHPHPHHPRLHPKTPHRRSHRSCWAAYWMTAHYW